MITVTLSCDRPTCLRQVYGESVVPRRLQASSTDLLTAAAAQGWWVDDLGRAWCQNHRSKPEPYLGPVRLGRRDEPWTEGRR